MSSCPGNSSSGLKRKIKLVLPIKDKLDILERIKKGESCTSLAAEYGISKSTITNINKSADKIKNFARKLDSEDRSKKRKSMKGSKFDLLDEALYKWFLQARASGQPISGPLLCDMALKFNVILGGDESDFAASQGWLDKFKSRHGIRQLDIQGEKMSANISAADAFVKEFSEKLQKEDYDLDLIYNADETGLCWKSLPFKTLASNREKAASGYKSSKDRVTLLACANASGTHRIPMLLIGKLKNPRCFQNIQIPLVYKNQSEGWMNREVFTDWYDNTFIPEVKMYQEKVNKVGKSVLLVLDSAPSHPDAEGLTRNGFRVLFLPPNVSSIIQPMDQGLIETMKRNYRKQLLSRLLFRDIEQEDCEHEKEEAESVSTFFKSIDLKDCCYMVVEAWNSVSPLTLKCAWNKLLYYYYEERYYLANPPIQGDNEGINTTDTLVTQTLETLDSLGLRGDCDSEDVLKWLESDKLDQGYPILSEEEIVKSVLTNNTNEEENDVEDMEPTSSLGPSATEAIKAFDVAFSWLEMQEEVEVVQLLQLRKMREMAIAKKLAESKQTYFTQNYGLL